MTLSKFGIFLFFAWVSIVFYLLPIPTNESIKESHNALQELSSTIEKSLKQDFLKEEIKKERYRLPTYNELKLNIRIRLAYMLVTVLFGLAGSTLIILGKKQWKIFLLLSACMFLAYTFDSLPRLIPSKENIQIWYMIATRLDDGLQTLYISYVFPLIQICVIAYIIWKSISLKINFE